MHMPLLVTLDNKLRVVLAPDDSIKTVTVLVMTKVGSRYETQKQSGIAHFTEHMMFKGTRRRPTTQVISRELDAVGAEFNAFTSKEYTGYYIKVHYQHLDMALDVLSDMLLNSVLDAREIEREKGVIIEEINMYEDTPMMMMEDVFEEVVYTGNPLMRDVAGSRETVNSFSRVDFISFISDFYRPANMLVSIAGNIPAERTGEMVKQYFTFPKKTDRIKSFRPYLVTRDRRILIKQKDTKQVHLALGLRTGLNHTAGRLLPLKIANIVFGGNMSSRLFIHIRERQGLCYYVRSKVNSFADTGDMAVYAGLDSQRIDRAIKLIVREFVRLGERGITARELMKAKEHVKGKMVITMENSSNVAQWYAERLLLAERLETPEEFLKKVDRISLSEVNGILKKVIRPRELHLALIGNYTEPDRFSNLLKI